MAVAKRQQESQETLTSYEKASGDERTKIISKKRWERAYRATCCQNCQRENFFQIDRSGTRKELAIDHIPEKYALYTEGIKHIHAPVGSK